MRSRAATRRAPRQTGPALVLTVVTAALILFASTAAAARAATDHGKDWQHCVQVVANLRARHPETPLVVLLGGSSARECTVSDASWARQIKRRSGLSVVAYNLGSKHRSYAEDLEFVKCLPRTRTIVFVGINLGRFCLAPATAIVDLPRARAASRYYQHRYSQARILSAAAKRSYVASWMDARWPEFEANCDGELAVLQQIIAVCRRRHLRVALLDLPLDLPAIGSALDAPVSTYQKACSLLARRAGIPWLHFVGSCGFLDSDFFDLFHLVQPGRVKFQSILSDKTIRLLKKYDMELPAPSASATQAAAATPSAAPSSRSASAVSVSAWRGPLLTGVAFALLLAGIGARIQRG